MESLRLVTVACVLVLALQTCQGADWGYTGATGVDNWATLFPDFCNGQSQSPINIDSASVMYDSGLGAFSFTGFDSTAGVNLILVNNGHTAQVNYDSGTLNVTGGGLIGTYMVKQFHFHWGSDNTQGSEHTMDGATYPMELHIVTYNTKYPNFTESTKHSDGLAVLGFFFEISQNVNPTVTKLVDALPSIKDAGSQVSLAAFPLVDLMAGVGEYFRYSGGLTTPTCNEIVTWTVFKNTIKINNAQMSAFRTLIDSHNHTMVDNYRPVLPLNGRSLTASFMDDRFLNSSPALITSTFALVLSLVVSLVAVL